MSENQEAAAGVESVAAQVSLAKLRRHDVVEDFWIAYRWRQKVKLANKGGQISMEDCRREIILANFDRVMRYALHLENVVNRMLKIVVIQKGKGWHRTYRNSNGQTRQQKITPVGLYGQLIEQVEMHDPPSYLLTEIKTGGENDSSD